MSSLNLSYAELIARSTFEERLEYLFLYSTPGDQTFGPLREINQRFYNSSVWKQVRREVIARDLGQDLAIPGRDIFGKVLVHHLNPLRPKDIYYQRENVVDLDNLITVSNSTHLLIHFGREVERRTHEERRPGDTQLWRPI